MSIIYIWYYLICIVFVYPYYICANHNNVEERDKKNWQNIGIGLRGFAVKTEKRCSEYIFKPWFI